METYGCGHQRARLCVPVVIVNGLVKATSVSRKKLFFAIHPPHNLGGDFGILVKFTYFWKSTGSELWCLDAWVDRTVSRGSSRGRFEGSITFSNLFAVAIRAVYRSGALVFAASRHCRRGIQQCM